MKPRRGGRIIGISTLQDTFFRPYGAEGKKRRFGPRADALGYLLSALRAFPLTDRQPQILPKKTHLFTRQPVWLFDYSERQGSHESVHVGYDRVFVLALRALDDLNPLQNDILETHLLQFVRAMHHPDVRAAMAAPYSHHLLYLTLLRSPWFLRALLNISPSVVAPTSPTQKPPQSSGNTPRFTADVLAVPPEVVSQF